MKNITLLLALCLTTFMAFAQTTLSAGDIAFLGVNTDGTKDADDSFAFVLLKDIDANTTIIFTDRGWNDGTGFVEPLAVGDGELTWTSVSVRSAGDVITLDFSNLTPGAASFTVLGDQLFAIQGTISSPVFIAGMQLNNATGSNDANWDGAAISNTTSALPDALTTGNTAIRFPIEQDNWQFSCIVGCPLSGTPEQIRTILHNPANWISDNNNVFPGTVDVNLGTITVGPTNTPPTITSLATANVQENQTAAIDVNATDDNDAEGAGLTYSLTGGTDQSFFSINAGTGVITFNSAPDFEMPIDASGDNVYEFQVTVTDSGTKTAVQDINITVTDVDDTSPTLVSTDPVDHATDVVTDAVLTVTFNEPVQWVPGGNNIAVLDLTTGLSFAFLNNTSLQVTFSGNSLSIDFNVNFIPGHEYQLYINPNTIQDAAGNLFLHALPDEWTFTTVMPVDNTPPIITCPVDIVFNSISNAECGDTVAWDAPVVTDNFPGVTITSNFNSDDLFPVGTTEVTYTATDAAGNQASCSFLVTVNDAHAPAPICSNGLSKSLDATTGLVAILATDFITSPITDACGEITYTISRATVDPDLDVRAPSLTLNCDDKETTLIRVWAEDVNGNSDYCETYILVDKSQFMCPVEPDPCQIMITAQLENAIIYAGDPLSFDVTATGKEALTYQWQVNIGYGFEDLGVPSANSQLSFAYMEIGGDGNQYQVIVTSDNGTPNDDTDDCLITSDVATLTVNPLTKVTVLKDVIGAGSNPDQQFHFFYNTSIPDELGEFYLSESGVNFPNSEGGEFSFKGSFLFLASEINLPEDYSINDIQIISDNGTSTLKSTNNNEIQILIAQSDNVTITFVNQYITQEPCEVKIITQPLSTSICAGEPLAFDVGATGTGALAYQWQVDTGTGFENLGVPSANSQLNFAYMEIGGDGNQYQVIVTSDNGTPNNGTDDCSATSEVATLTVNPVPVVAITGKDSYCYNGNGVELDAGAGHSSYLWSPSGATTQTITALEGSYTVQVTNEFGCTKISEAFMVTNNRPLVCNILQDVLTTDHETTDGVATVNTTGGTGQFTYLWDNGETTQTATTLTYGMHSVTVTDSNGCETTCQIDMAKELYCWTNLVQNVSVRGGNDGGARVRGNGGYRPYTYLWGDGSTGELNTALKVGTHDVTITDASGATSQCSVTITEPNTGNCNDFTTSIVQEKLTTNHVTTDGVATVYPKGGTGQYTYLWDNGETTQTATTITYGMHSVTVIDAAGCISIAQIDIAKELYCWINLYKHVSVHDAKDGAAMVHGNGGYRPHTFLWEDGSTAQLNSNLSAGTHYVTITDATGATSQCSITITEPNQEVCDGVDNDGDGQIDEGFDKDGDGIADCFDICDKGDDHVDMDNDGIPDACDDNICIKVEKPMKACYQTAVWDERTCGWIISGEQPLQPMTECNQTAEWNGTTCTWDIIDGQRPEMPMTECYQMAAWNTQTCSWEINGEQPMQPMTECHQTAVWNSDNCIWDIIDGQPEMPVMECYQSTEWNEQSCSWVVTGEQPMEPETECFETAVWNSATCTWDILDGQPEMPVTECYQTADWNEQNCSWEVTGEQPTEPETECYETAVWNGATCTWGILDGQPEMPVMECYKTKEWNEQSCSWDVTGEQPQIPETECNETAIWNELACNWDIIENNNDCGSGAIDQCETAFARSADENVRSCFIDIPNVSGNRWGWTNEFPSTNGTYNMDLYAAAGQCTISNGALVGNVEVTYTDGAIEVTVSTLSGYKMTVAQLYVGTEILPTDNNGRFTTAPGQYPYSDTVGGDFNTFTFESVNVGNPGNFYVVLHADVCPNVRVPEKTASANVELTAYPIPFKHEINLKLVSPRKMKGELSIYDVLGQKVHDFGSYNLKEGENEIKLHVNELPVGMYFIHMSSDYGNEILKILGK